MNISKYYLISFFVLSSCGLAEPEYKERFIEYSEGRMYSSYPLFQKEMIPGYRRHPDSVMSLAIFKGDTSAFHEKLTEKQFSRVGEWGEAWIYDVQHILIVWGDQKSRDAIVSFFAKRKRDHATLVTLCDLLDVTGTMDWWSKKRSDRFYKDYPLTIQALSDLRKKFKLTDKVKEQYTDTEFLNKLRMLSEESTP